MDRHALHPDDVLFFSEVRQLAFNIARKYKLKLLSFEPYPDPEYATSVLGYCTVSGDVRVAFRGMSKGVWDEFPRRKEDIIKTAAHELAHLKHMNHGVEFQDFEGEMQDAFANQQEDHRKKIMRRLVKMQAQAESEKKLGNAEAAEAFAAAINRMMLDYELRPSDVDYARVQQDDPIVEVVCDLSAHGVPLMTKRIAWQERLASTVAYYNLCRFLIRTGSNYIWFVGTKSHATVAEYVYGMLVREAGRWADKEYVAFYRKMKAQDRQWEVRGYRSAWLRAFCDRVDERLKEQRAEVVKEVTPEGESSSTAIIRLETALVKVKSYIDDKFKGQSRTGAAYLRTRYRRNEAGDEAGRAAADRVPIGRKGVGSSTGRKLLS